MTRVRRGWIGAGSPSLPSAGASPTPRSVTGSTSTVPPVFGPPSSTCLARPPRLAYLGWPEGSGVGDDRLPGLPRGGQRRARRRRGRGRPGGRHRAGTADRPVCSLAAAPTAIVCVSDGMAFGCDADAREARPAPGRDVGVAGFNDSPPPVCRPCRSPAFTSRWSCRRSLGRLLVERLAEPDASASRCCSRPGWCPGSSDPQHRPTRRGTPPWHLCRPHPDAAGGRSPALPSPRSVAACATTTMTLPEVPTPRHRAAGTDPFGGGDTEPAGTRRRRGAATG